MIKWSECVVFSLSMFLAGLPQVHAQVAQWSQIPTDLRSTPSPRYGQGVVYDSNRGIVILHGGYRLGTVLSDTWEWDGQIWVKIFNSGPGRYCCGMAFDPGRNVVVLYGGYNDTEDCINRQEYSAVTWEFDGEKWQGIHYEDDAPRTGAALVYDPRLKCVIRHGGSKGDPAQYAILNETWKWDGVRWCKIAFGPKRAFHKMVYDSIRKAVLLFGGTDQRGSDPNDTWEFDGTNWIQAAAEGPEGRESPGFAFDESRGVAVLCGGGRLNGFIPQICLGDTWEWDGFRWTPDNSSGPGLAYVQDMAYDSQRKRMVLFRGAGTKNPSGFLKNFQETWEYEVRRSGIPFLLWGNL